MITVVERTAEFGDTEQQALPCRCRNGGYDGGICGSTHCVRHVQST